EHISARDRVHRHPAADVTDVGHPGPVTATPLQLNTDPAVNGVLVEHRAVMGGTVGVELFQVPDAGGTSESDVRLERQVGIQLGGESAGEAVATHDRTASGTGRTQSSRRSRSTLMYRFVDSWLAWPSTSEIVGNGTAAASSRDAALWRSNRVPAFTLLTPAFWNVSTVTRCTVA